MTNFLITTKIDAHPCHRCGAVILAGFAEGLHARVDLAPLDHGEEIHALLAGLWTYTLIPTGELVHRDAGRIAGGYLHGPTLGTHHCAETPASNTRRRQITKNQDPGRGQWVPPAGDGP
jgi:hypothetical protein